MRLAPGSGFGDARVIRLHSIPPIRSRSAEEGGFEIPWWGIPLVLIVLYVCLFSGLGAIGLVGPDEPRYAAIARAMAETHDWVTPRLWGTPWFEKPVLYYWTAGLAMRIFGVSEFAARLPSALAGLLAVIAVTWTALRSYGVGAAWYSLLMLPTSVAMIGFSRAAGPDMLFAALLAASMAVAVEMLQMDRPGAVSRIAFGFFLGAAVLAKGPAAVILAGGATLLWAAITRQWRAPFRFLHPLVIAVFCLTAVPWYVLCAIRNPDFLRVFIWQHNFERYTTPIFEHRQPVWFYSYILILAVLPWVFFLLEGLIRTATRLKSRAALESVDLFLASSAAFPIIFFSLSQSKLPGYILPAIPPLFILLARWASKSYAEGGQRVLRAFGWTGGALLVCAITAAAMGLNTHYKYPAEYFQVESLMFLFGAIILLLSFKERVTTNFWLLGIMVVAIVLTANFFILPRLDSFVSIRQLATNLRQQGMAEKDLSLYNVTRSTQYGLDYYVNRDLPVWIPGKSEPQLILGTLPSDDYLRRDYVMLNDPLREYVPRFVVYRRKQ